MTKTNGIPSEGEANAPDAKRPGMASLPCLDSHNDSEKEIDLSFAIESRLMDHISRKAEWALSGSQKKSVFALRNNLEAHCDAIGLDRIGFLTVTAKKRGFNQTDDFTQNVFKPFINSDTFKRLFGTWYRVYEPHLSGEWHAHMLVECKGQIREGVDIEKLREAQRCYSNNRSHAYELYADCCSKDHVIRQYWRALREFTEASSHVGRINFEPVKSSAEGIGKYLRKYLQKAMASRSKIAWLISTGYQKQKKRSRLWAKSKDAARVVNCQFAWNSPRAKEWRKALGLFGEVNGIKDGDMKGRYGPRWCFHLHNICKNRGINFLAASSSEMRDIYLEMEIDARWRYKNQ